MKTSALVTLLQSTASVTALLSAPTAVYEQVLPRGYVFPAIVVHRYASVHDQDFNGPVGLQEDNFQLDMYGGTSAACDSLTDAVRALLIGYNGTLPDGTVIQNVYLEQDRDMPFLPGADTTSMAFRSLLGLRFVTNT